MPTATSTAMASIVLVHGGFADGSGWQGVYDILANRGYRVSIVQNPRISLDDVAVSERVIAAQPAGWRLGAESNRCTRLCRPLHHHSAT